MKVKKFVKNALRKKLTSDALPEDLLMEWRGRRRFHKRSERWIVSRINCSPQCLSVVFSLLWVSERGDLASDPAGKVRTEGIYIPHQQTACLTPAEMNRVKLPKKALRALRKGEII